ncbi:hypothetical protein N7501_006676 [Penicillium viridicatum]|nr:hypothetical protein N7501_006676 [Penicillium viridicatum]
MHGKAHTLIGKHGGSTADKASYTQYCASEHRVLQTPPPLDPRSDDTPDLKCVQFEHCSRQYLRLDAHSDIGLSWYLSILSFKQPIEELIRDESDPSDPSDTNAVTWHTTMLATFSLTIPGL